MSFTDSRHLLWLPLVFQVLGTSKSCAVWHQMSRGLRPHDGDQSGQLYIGDYLCGATYCFYMWTSEASVSVASVTMELS